MQTWSNYGFTVAYVAAQLGISPGAASLVLSGYAPTVVNSGSTTLATIMAQALAGNSVTGTGGITTSASASRTSGTAPFAVFFDATATTNSLAIDNFHDILYLWNFGDSEVAWTYGTGVGDNSKNRARGGVAAHVYETSGSYTAKVTPVTVSSGGTLSYGTTTSISITVAAADTTYAGTATYVISTSGTFTGKPTGATEITTSSVTTALASASTANRRFLFRGGETFNIDNEIEIKKAGIQIGSFGTGKANFAHTATINKVRLWDGANDASGFVWMDASFDSTAIGGGGNPLACQAAIGGTLSNVLMLRCDAYKTGSLATVSAVTGMFVVDCNAHDLLGGSGNVGFYAEYGYKTAILGSQLVECLGIEHNIRLQGVDKVVASNNTLRQAGTSGKQLFTLRGYSNQATLGNPGLPTWSGIWSGTAVVSDNKFEGGSTGTGMAVEFQPQNSGAYEKIRDVVCERNLWTGIIGTPIGSQVVDRCTIRNNCFYIDYTSYTDGRFGVDLTASSVVGTPVSSSHYIYNNSVYITSAAGWSFVSIDKVAAPATYPTGNLITNNLLYAPNATKHGGNFGSAPSVLFTPGAPAGNYTITTTTSDAQLKATAPGFTIPPTSTLTTWKPTSGYGINGGTYVPVFDDFFGSARIGTYDLGAANP